MSSTPPLSSHNRFNVLVTENTYDFDDDQVVQNSEVPPVSEPSPPPLHSLPPSRPIRRPKWEKSLPKRFVVAATEDGSKSLKLKVEIETTDTAERKSVLTLVDCGATGEFIDRNYAKSCRFNLVKLSVPIPVYNIDGTLNEAGSVTEVVDLILRYKNHSERTIFAVSNLGKQKLILGHSWLRKHNPEINWATGEVKMSRCPPPLLPRLPRGVSSGSDRSQGTDPKT